MENNDNKAIKKIIDESNSKDKIAGGREAEKKILDGAATALCAFGCLYCCCKSENDDENKIPYHVVSHTIPNYNSYNYTPPQHNPYFQYNNPYNDIKRAAVYIASNNANNVVYFEDNIVVSKKMTIIYGEEIHCYIFYNDINEIPLIRKHVVVQEMFQFFLNGAFFHNAGTKFIIPGIVFPVDNDCFCSIFSLCNKNLNVHLISYQLI